MQLFRTMDNDLAEFANRGRQGVAVALQMMRYEKPPNWTDPSAATTPANPTVPAITEGMDNDLAIYFAMSPLFEENAVEWQRMRYRKPSGWLDPSATPAPAAAAAATAPTPPTA